MENKLKLLWIDDDIDKLEMYVKALRREGFKVYTASNYFETENVIKKVKIDIFLVDIQIPEINGIEIIRLIYKKFPYAKFAILSSFLYLQRNKDELQSLDIPVQLIDKYLPNVKSESFNEKFINPIRSLSNNGVTFTIEDVNTFETNKCGIEPFNIDYAKFMQLSLIEKDRLSDIAERTAIKTIEKEFKRGKIWVLLCGNPKEISASAEYEKDIPSEDKVLKIAKTKNRAPFQFSKGLISEDHWMNCPSDKSLIDYPTVTLEIYGTEMNIHFDTGCPSTKFSYEELIVLGAIPNASHFITEWRNGFDKYKCVIIEKMNAILKSQKDGQTTLVVIKGKAIRDWSEHSYARKCSGNCELKDTKNNPDGFCSLRKALIGRNLLTENKLKLILDGNKKITYF
jgi:CheY-like chemotaxis protein